MKYSTHTSFPHIPNAIAVRSRDPRDPSRPPPLPRGRLRPQPALRRPHRPGLRPGGARAGPGRPEEAPEGQGRPRGDGRGRDGGQAVEGGRHRRRRHFQLEARHSLTHKNIIIIQKIMFFQGVVQRDRD